MSHDNLGVFKSLEKYMTTINCWPREGEHISSMFVIKSASPVLLFTTPSFIGITGHLYKSISEKCWSNAVMDLFFLIDCIMFTICGVIFLTLVTKLQRIMEEFSRHRYGISKNFEYLNARIDKITNGIFYLLTLASWCYLPFWCIWENNCLSKKDLEGNTIQGYVKGLICPAWFPFDPDNFPWRVPIFICNVVMWMYYVPRLSCPIILIYGFVKLIIDRVEHLTDILKGIHFSDINSELTKNKLRLCMKYNNEITLLWRDVNSVIGSIFAPTQNGISTLMIGLLEYAIIVMRSSVVSLYVIFFYFVIGQAMLCYSGQMLEDAHEKLKFHVYDIPWYEMKSSVRKDYKIFHACVQSTLHLKIKPNNKLNMQYYFQVMKGAYSWMMYLTNF